MKKICFLITLCIFFACKNNTKNSPIGLFFDHNDLLEMKCNFNEDSLALIETILCNDSFLVVFDYHSGNSFTLFSLHSENYLGRFGEIGQGPGEIPLGCYGNLDGTNFTIHYGHTGLIAKYPIDSLFANIKFKPLLLAKYEIADAQFSRVIPLNDSLFMGAGTYQSNFQFVLFDKKSNVLDFNVEIFNARDENFNIFHKYLSNQGIFRKHPTQNKFVYAINYSSNIDFVEVLDDKIKLLNSIRLRNPKSKPEQAGGLNRVLPDSDSPIGYIDISASNNYVYTLYTDKKMIEDNGLGNDFSSNIVLVFDWEGNPIRKLHLKHDAYYICVNEKSKKMYAAIKNEKKGWSIISYEL